MALTPLDADKAKFRSVLRGYARDEVERFRVDVIATLEEHIARGAELAGRVAELESQLARYRENEELLKSSVVLAQRTCDELIAAAHKQADVIKQEARLEGDQIRQQLAELRAQREQFEYAFHGLLTGFKHRLEQGNPRLVARETSAALTGGSQADEVASEATDDDEDLVAEQGGHAPSGPPRDEAPRPRIPGVPAPPSVTVPGVPPIPADPGAAPRAVARGGSEDLDADIADFTRAVAEAAELRDRPWPAAADSQANEPRVAEAADESTLFDENA